MNTYVVKDPIDYALYGTIETEKSLSEIQSMIDELKRDNPYDYNTEMMKEMFMKNGISYTDLSNIVYF